LVQAQKLEALGQLTGGVAHDFNNLLMAASSGLELIERTNDQQRKDQLRKGVRDALDHGARLTHHLLAFSRQSPVQTEVISVASRIDQLAELLDRSLRENVSVSFDIPSDIWPIEVDTSQFDIAVLNIAVNARDAMPNGGAIVISARNLPGGLDGADAVEIRIEDEGTGMSPETAEKAFEPFFTMKDVGQGTGLGLSQVYGFTRSAGGAASIASEPGAGTIVSMTFPRCVRSDERREPQPGPKPTIRIEHKSVLLVEDDAALSDFVGQMLEELGSTVIRARSARAALRAFAGGQVDLAISDMVMPGSMDGLALARRLREKDGQLPILLMTGYSAAAADAAAEGFVVLRKPFSFETLAAHLTSAIEASGQDGAAG
jgi:CheY-like chemotaxis protein